MEIATSNLENEDLLGSISANQDYKKLVAWTESTYRKMKESRVSTENQWYYNLAFFFGKQWVQPDRTIVGKINQINRLVTPPAPYWRARPVHNKIRPVIRTELAKLTSNKPSASVVPASAEDRDMYAAMAGESIWDYYYREKKVKFVIRRALWWTLNCGTGYIKCYWDPTMGEQGDVQFKAETPFHVLVPDLREEEIEDQPYLMHVSLRSPEWVQQHYKLAIDGEQIKGIPSTTNQIIDESFLGVLGGDNIDKKKALMVKEVYIKPGGHPQFPDGAFFTTVGDQIVSGQQGMPYRHGKYPFAKFDHIPTGKYYSSSSTEDLIPLQKEYNRTHGQIIEAKNRMAKPQMVAQRGSVDVSKITTEPGQFIMVTPGFEYPKPIPLVPLPNYVLDELDRIQNDMNDISGQHEVTHGQVPPGVTAATAISYLQEQDESKLTPTFDSLEEGSEKIAHMCLTYVHEYWDDERTIKVTGPDGSFDAMAFKGSDLNNNFDIKVEAGSALPVSKAAKQSLIMDMMKMGFIEPNKGLEVMEMGGINKIYDQLRVDQRQAQRENLKMSKITPEILQQQAQINQQKQAVDPAAFGAYEDPDTMEQVPLEPPPIVPVNSWDNHMEHIKHHNNFRKGQAFEVLPQEIKDIFEAHVMGHVEAMGTEMITMNPRIQAGLPEIPLGEEQPGGSMPPSEGAPPVDVKTPGLNPMPGLASEGAV